MSALDYTQVTTASIAAVASIANGLGVVIVLRKIRTDSGERIGSVVEKTHDNAAAAMMVLTEQLKRDDEARSDNGQDAE